MKDVITQLRSNIVVGGRWAGMMVGSSKNWDLASTATQISGPKLGVGIGGRNLI